MHAPGGGERAGKSTLMKILTGIYQKDGGEIEIQGKPVDIVDSRQAQDLGISIIHQSLNLMKDLDGGREHLHRPGACEGMPLNKRQ